MTAETAATRAVAAAREMSAECCGPIAPPADVDKLVLAVIRAYEAYDGRHLTEPISHELQGALVDLSNETPVASMTITFLSESERDISLRAAAVLAAFYDEQVAKIPDWHPLHGEWRTQGDCLRRSLPRAFTALQGGDA